MNYFGALGLANTTYSILTNIGTISERIQTLIKSGELSHIDQLNFKSLMRKLDLLQEPLNYLLI
jgi:hypothetical protein